MLNREDILKWLEDEVHMDMTGVDDDTPLFSSGALDSLSMVELVALIEDKTGLAMPALDVTPENIDTIARVVAWVERAEKSA